MTLTETQVTRMMRAHNISRERAEALTIQEAMDMNTTKIYLHAKHNYDAMKRRQKKEAKK
jgi:hypothetical protein